MVGVEAASVELLGSVVVRLVVGEVAWMVGVLVVSTGTALLVVRDLVTGRLLGDL